MSPFSLSTFPLLLVFRWKRGRDRAQERPPQQPQGQMDNQQQPGVAPLLANGAVSAALQTENGAPQEVQDAAMPLARGLAPKGDPPPISSSVMCKCCFSRV